MTYYGCHLSVLEYVDRLNESKQKYFTWLDYVQKIIGSSRGTVYVNRPHPNYSKNQQ